MASVSGTIRTVGVVKGTLVITTSNTKDLALRINSATKVTVRGALFGALGLTAGMRVEARYATTNNVASTIPAKDAPESKESAMVSVRVGAVDSALRTITITLDGGGSSILKTTAGTQFKINGRGGVLAGIHAGDRIRASYDAGAKTATNVDNRGQA